MNAPDEEDTSGLEEESHGGADREETTDPANLPEATADLPASASSEPTEEQKREIRKLEKKIRACTDIEDRMKRGENVDVLQLEKLQGLPDLRAELESRHRNARRGL